MLGRSVSQIVGLRFAGVVCLAVAAVACGSDGEPGTGTVPVMGPAGTGAIPIAGGPAAGAPGDGTAGGMPVGMAGSGAAGSAPTGAAGVDLVQTRAAGGHLGVRGDLHERQGGVRCSIRWVRL